MKKIIILRGNSGSGKTTVARALQKKFGYNTMVISQDEIRRNILWVKDGVDTKALPLMIELMKYLCLSIIDCIENMGMSIVMWLF